MSDAPKLTKQELADARGVSLRAVEHWLEDGLPSTKERRGTPPRSVVVIDAAEAERWLALHRPADTGVDPEGRMAAAKTRTAELDARKRAAEVEKLELENQVRAGQLLDAEEVRLGRLARIAETTRILEALPAVAAPLCAHRDVNEIRVILAREIDRARREFAREDETP